MGARIVIGIILAGILGCIATGAVVSLVTGADFLVFLTTWGKYGVSIAIAILLPFIFSAMGKFSAIVIGFLVLDAVSAAVTMWFFDGPAWEPVLAFNAVYAIVAVLVYAAIAGTGHRRRVVA